MISPVRNAVIAETSTAAADRSLICLIFSDFSGEIILHILSMDELKISDAKTIPMQKMTAIHSTAEIE